MAVKSVIEIDVHDEKFKAFQASFDKYQKTLDLQQKRWAEVNKTFDQINKKQKDFNKLDTVGKSTLYLFLVGMTTDSILLQEFKIIMMKDEYL